MPGCGALFALALAVAVFGTSDAARAQVPGVPVPLPPPPSLPSPTLPPPPTLPKPPKLPQLPQTPPPPQVPVATPSLPTVTPPLPPPPSPPRVLPPAAQSHVDAAVGSLGGRSAARGPGGGGNASGGGSARGDASGGAAGRPAATARDRRVRVDGQAVAATGPRRQRKVVVIRFTLARPAIVRFALAREAPDCVRIGAFSVRGKAGRNRVVFTGRFRGAPLPAGTYSLHATALRGGRAVSLGRVRVVVVEPGRNLARARPAPSACSRGIGASVARSEAPPAQAGGSAGIVASGGGVVAVEGAPSADGGAPKPAAAAAAAGAEELGAEARDGRILGVLTQPLDGVPAWLRPLLLAVLGASILLFAAAALPATAVRPAGAAPVVEHRRAQLALLGATLFGVVALSALLL